MIGGALGVAASTAVFQIGARSSLADVIKNANLPVAPTEAQFESFLAVLTGGPGLDDLLKAYPQVQEAIITVFNQAVGRAMLPSIVVSAIGAVLALWLLRGRSQVEEEVIEV